MRRCFIVQKTFDLNFCFLISYFLYILCHSNKEPKLSSPSSQVILACLAAVALARPQLGDPDQIDILRDERVDNGDGTFNFLFETENGIYKEVNGRPGANGGQAMEGSFR